MSLAEIGPGNENAALEVERAIQHFKPSVVVFMGVAGGLKDVLIGDVVAATKVYGYEYGKDTCQFMPRPMLAQTSYSLEQRARAEAKKPDWISRIAGEKPQQVPRALVEPIAAGAKVVADTCSSTFEFLREQYSDAVAVEMEGFGFLRAAHANSEVQCIVVRGISDLIDGKTTADRSGSQVIASKHAAAFVYQILSNLRGPDRSNRHSLWSIPHDRNPNFTGRAALLADLAKPAAPNTTAIHALAGLGGIGKTQVAVEYAYRSRSTHTLVWWLRAGDPLLLAQDFANMALPLGAGLSETGHRPIEQKCAEVKDALSRRADWLLIFDNADAPAQVGHLIPEKGGQVIITSRNPNWRGLGEVHELDVLPRPDAVALIQRRSGQTDIAAAASLAEELGDLPLALDQAAAYLEQTARPIADYLALFSKRRAELLSLGPFGTYPATVATTWDISFGAAIERSSAAGDLLRLCSFWASDQIPSYLFADDSHRLPSGLGTALRDETVFDEAIASLRRYSLISRSDRGISVHRLIQAVTRDRLSESERKGWATHAIQLIDEQFHFDPFDPEARSRQTELFPHAREAVHHAEAQGVAMESVERVLNEIAACLHDAGDDDGAKNTLDRSLEIATAVHGGRSTIVASRLSNLGAVLDDLAKYGESMNCFDKALEIETSERGSDSRGRIAILVNFARVLLRNGQLDRAHDLLLEALRVLRLCPGEQADILLPLLNNLGRTLEEAGKLAEALRVYEDALEIVRGRHGADHPCAAAILNNIGGIHYRLDDSKRASEFYERAQRLMEAVHGPDHPKNALALSNLAVVYGSLGRKGEALAKLQEALRIDQRFYGSDHPNVGVRLSNLSAIVARTDIAEAVRLSRRALEIAETSLGPNHPTVGLRLANLGHLRQLQGDLAEAEQCDLRALSIHEAALGEDSAEVGMDLYQLAAIMNLRGDRSGARRRLDHAIRILQARLGNDHLHTRLAMEELSKQRRS